MRVRRLATVWQRLRRTIRGAPRDLQFDAEMAEHVRLLAERYRRQGMDEEPAMLAARCQFGNAVLLQEDRRAMQTMPAIEACGRDLLFGVRMLRKNLAFSRNLQRQITECVLSSGAFVTCGLLGKELTDGDCSLPYERGEVTQLHSHSILFTGYSSPPR